MIATSTLLSYDVYRHYFNPSATSKEIVAASRYFILFWAIFSSGLASIFKAVGIVTISLFFYPDELTDCQSEPGMAVLFPWRGDRLGGLSHCADFHVRTVLNF
jgi:Na+/proline symporter